MRDRELAAMRVAYHSHDRPSITQNLRLCYFFNFSTLDDTGLSNPHCLFGLSKLEPFAPQHREDMRVAALAFGVEVVRAQGALKLQAVLLGYPRACHVAHIA